MKKTLILFFILITTAIAQEQDLQKAYVQDGTLANAEEKGFISKNDEGLDYNLMELYQYDILDIEESYKQQTNIFKSAEQIHKENLRHLKNFVDADIDTPRTPLWNANAPKYISPKEAGEVRREALLNPIVSLWAYDKYDPENRGIGFCFGRAMFTHTMLNFRGIDYDSVKKAFVVGPMTTGGDTSWGWHVTTIVQSRDADGNEEWLAVDPITGLQSLNDWYLEMLEDFSTNKRLKIYVTHAGKFGPSPGWYTHQTLENEFYNDYFKDMDEWFGKQETKAKSFKLFTEEYNPKK